MALIFQSRQAFEQEIILLFRDGKSIRFLSRAFNISRNTVRRILRDHEASRASQHEILPIRQTRKSKLDEFNDRITEILKEFPAITGQRIFEELVKDGYDGGVSILRDHLRKIRVVEKEPVIRFETGPGHQGQMDWSPYTIPFTRTGPAGVQCFSYILGHSRRHFIEFCARHDFFTLIRRHLQAFEYFGGVPAECLYDNEKTVVLRWEAGKPVFNPAFTAFITHYNCRPVACRVGSPQTKGKIERPFQHVEGNLLCGRKFQDIEDLRATARWWLENISDRHIHDTTGRAPIEHFLENEKSALQPLPGFPYDCSEVRLAVCNSESLVTFETNRYSVPTGYIGDILSIKAGEREIKIYSHELKLLAKHERRPAGENSLVEDPSHHRVKREKYGLEPVKEAFLSLGDGAPEFLAGLERKFPRNVGFQVRHILNLKTQFNSDDIYSAMLHAARYASYDAKAVERILAVKAQPRTLESIRNEKARQQLAETLPEIKQRPLHEYSELFQTQETNHENTTNAGHDQRPSADSEAEENTGKARQ